MNKDLKKAVENLFDQLRFITINLSDEQFSKPTLSLSGSSIGQHFRHTLEFFQCLLTEENELINYDQRRHKKSLENYTSEALQLINEQSKTIETLTSNKEFTLELSYGLEQSKPIKVNTNLERELVYNIEHTVHHMALMKIGLKEIAPELKLPIGFGVADSTIQYHNTQQLYS